MLPGIYASDTARVQRARRSACVERALHWGAQSPSLVRRSDVHAPSRTSSSAELEVASAAAAVDREGGSLAIGCHADRGMVHFCLGRAAVSVCLI